MKNYFITILISLGLFILISCSKDNTTNPSNPQGTQQEFSDMLGQANPGFTKLSGNAPDSSTDANAPKLVYISNNVSGTIFKNAPKDIILSDISAKITITAGQSMNFNTQVNNVQILSTNNLDFFMQPEETNNYYMIDPASITMNGNNVSFTVKTLKNSKPGTYHLKFNFKDKSTGLISNFLWFEIEIKGNNINTSNKFEILTKGTWRLYKTGNPTLGLPVTEVPEYAASRFTFFKNYDFNITNPYGQQVNAKWKFIENESKVEVYQSGNPSEILKINEISNDILDMIRENDGTIFIFKPL